MVTEAERRALAPYCAGCGQPAGAGAHDRCLRPLDPPRFCADCGRKLAVQVLPTGFDARCLSCPR